MMALKPQRVGAIYFYHVDQQMNNIYINNIYIIIIPSCFNASASSSGSLKLVL